MKYRAVVEIEFEAEGDPLEPLQRIMNRTGWEVKGLSHWVRLTGEGPYADHYHILEQPKEMP
jgi:hypothetical protein